MNTTTGERTLIAKGQLTGRHVLRHLAARHALPLLEGQQVPGLRPRGRRRPRRSARAGAVELHRPRSTTTREPSRPFGVAGYTSDGKAVIANHRYDLWLLPLDGSAPTNLTGGLGDQERDALPPRPDRAGGPERRPRSVGPRGTFDLTKPVTLSAYGAMDEEGRLLRTGRRTAEGAGLRGRVVQHTGEGAQGRRFLFTRQTFVEFPDLRVVGPGLRRFEEDHRRQSRSRRTSCGATACCSTSRTRTACGCRASWRCPTTTSRARSGR